MSQEFPRIQSFIFCEKFNQADEDYGSSRGSAGRLVKCL